METDPGGFLNNIYISPPKPADSIDEPSIIGAGPVDAPVKHTDTNTNGNVANGHPPTEERHETVNDSNEAESSPPQAGAEPAASDSGKATTTLPNSDPKPETLSTGYPQLFSDIASTIVARDGTSSALSYVASGIGAAMHNMVGIDPINIPKVCFFPGTRTRDNARRVVVC